MYEKYICGCKPAALFPGVYAVLLAVFCFPAYAQNSAGKSAQEADAAGAAVSGAVTLPAYMPPARVDPFELLTLHLPELFARFGAPSAVYAVRGEHEWQDDVVLEYPGVDFYIYKDQVWQVGLEKAPGISKGDPERTIALVFKEASHEKERVTVIFNDRPQPAAMRFIIKNGKISAIYLYRVNY
ncbi:MAG: hypothetical protein LBG72_08600 [Spirochaetaceae bacterium]|jgi:hypothetical protein|nr:hypothetical protein [Spirochaetaceae bacterium]